MALLGVLARVHASDRALVIDHLNALDGVTTFSVEDEHKIGLLVERDTMREAHQALTERIRSIPGVLGTWPVFSHFASDL